MILRYDPVPIVRSQQSLGWLVGKPYLWFALSLLGFGAGKAPAEMQKLQAPSSSEEGVGGRSSKLDFLCLQLFRLRSSFIEGVERIASRD